MFEFSTENKNICSKTQKGGRQTRNTYIPPADLSRIMRHADPYYRQIFTLAIETGFRIDDLLTLRIYQAAGSAITLIEAKTRKQRTVTLSLEAREAIKKSIKGKGHPFGYLFPSKTSKTGQKRRKLHRTTVYRQFERAVKAAGLNGNGYTVHSLRKVYAHRLYDETQSVTAVMRDLNHDRISTTLIYISDLKI